MKNFSFIGVTTAQSAIMRVFPAWARHLGLDDTQVTGHDLPLRAEPRQYRALVETIRSGPAELGALVTSHKIALFEACRDQFDFIDPYAELCGEVSCLSKRDGLFRAHAKDPISSGRALDEFVSPGYWERAGGEALLFGAGGSNLAITLHLLVGRPSGDRPARILVVNRSAERLAGMRAVHERTGHERTGHERTGHERIGHEGIGATTDIEYINNSDPAYNDKLLGQLAPGSLVVNGTGMGKDTPGSPITGDGVFPEQALVWELNYRGQLDFVRQAERQKASRGLIIEDGWRYFVHGWTCVIEEVFALEMTPSLVGELSEIALATRG